MLFHAAINTSTSFVPVPWDAFNTFGPLVDPAIETTVLALTLHHVTSVISSRERDRARDGTVSERDPGKAEGMR
jgi:hypothetical protein